MHAPKHRDVPSAPFGRNFSEYRMAPRRQKPGEDGKLIDVLRTTADLPESLQDAIRLASRLAGKKKPRH